MEDRVALASLPCFRNLDKRSTKPSSCLTTKNVSLLFFLLFNVPVTWIS